MVDLHELTWTVVQDIDLSERIKKKKKKGAKQKIYYISIVFKNLSKNIYVNIYKNWKVANL